MIFACNLDGYGYGFEKKLRFQRRPFTNSLSEKGTNFKVSLKQDIDLRVR